MVGNLYHQICYRTINLITFIREFGLLTKIFQVLLNALQENTIFTGHFANGNILRSNQINIFCSFQTESNYILFFWVKTKRNFILLLKIKKQFTENLDIETVYNRYQLKSMRLYIFFPIKSVVDILNSLIM